MRFLKQFTKQYFYTTVTIIQRRVFVTNIKLFLQLLCINVLLNICVSSLNVSCKFFVVHSMEFSFQAEKYFLRSIIFKRYYLRIIWFTYFWCHSMLCETVTHKGDFKVQLHRPRGLYTFNKNVNFGNMLTCGLIQSKKIRKKSVFFTLKITDKN